jgi:hypothetical protein
MSSELTPYNILNIAKICQYLSVNSVSVSNIYKGKATDERIARMIWAVKEGVQYRYDQNPNDSTLIATSNYLWSLLGRFQLIAQARLAILKAVPPVITGPVNVTVQVGGNATFQTSVSSSLPYTVQWYDQFNNTIPGATSTTYVFSNAQLTDSGKTFYMKATSASGTVSSSTAVLVVQSQITAYAWYGATDPYPALSAGTDNLPYQIQQNITHNNPITITWPLAAGSNQYQVIKVPGNESTKTTWFNTVLNNGVIPDPIFRTPTTIGSFVYYVSRVAMSLDGSTLTETFS